MDVDVVVIGAGAGGLLTAARLAHLGYRTLVAERLGLPRRPGLHPRRRRLQGQQRRDRDRDRRHHRADLRRGGRRVRHPGAGPADPVPDRRQGRRRHRGRLGLPAVPAHPLRRPGAGRAGRGAPGRRAARRRAVDRRLAVPVHQERVRARHLPQHVRVGVRGRPGRAPGPGLPHLLHPQERVQDVRLLPARDRRHLGVAGRRDRRGGRPGLAGQRGALADHGGRPGHRRRHRPWWRRRRPAGRGCGQGRDQRRRAGRHAPAARPGSRARRATPRPSSAPTGHAR